MCKIIESGSGAPLSARLVAVIFVAASVVEAVSPAIAEDAARTPDETTARARALIKSMLKEREKIVSAVVHVRGSVVFARNEPPPERTIRGTYAFDHSQDALRFDSSRRMTVRRIKPGALAAAGYDIKAAMARAEERQVDARLHFARTPELSTIWNESTDNSRSSVQIRPSGVGIGAGLATTHYFIDLRACGVMSHFEFTNQGPESEFGVAGFCDALLKMSVATVTETRNEAVFILRSEFAEHRLTIDTARQFTPVEYCRSWKKGPGNSSDGSSTSRVKWMEVNGVMVPRSFTIEFDWPDEGDYALHNFICLWHSVNQPIDKNRFDYKTFPDIPPRTDVVDARIKGNPTVGFWTEDGIVGPEENLNGQQPQAVAAQPEPRNQNGNAAPIVGNKAGEERDDNSLGMTFAWCPPGRFVMGSPKNEVERFDGEDQTEVVLTQGFWIGKYEVTQGEWTQLKTPLLWKSQKYIVEGDDYPATYLSWENAMAFCRQLTQQEKTAGRLPAGWHYTLPTEAQWEYACRAGSATRYCFGEDFAPLQDYAWTRESFPAGEERHPQPVGQKKPNAWGLHDMHGNVSEWCRDGWQEKLPGGTDPLVPPGDVMRVIRGSHYNFPGVVCRSAFRESWHAVDRSNFMGEIGFRVVLCPVERKPE